MSKKGLYLGLLFLVACAPQSAPLATQGDIEARLAPTQIVESIASSTPLEKETPEPDFVDTDCLQRLGEMQYFDLDSEVLDQGLQFRIYLPPCYHEQNMRKFAVLYLIHGQTFNDDQWDRLGVDDIAESLINADEVSPFLIVMPFDLGNAQPSIDPFNRAFIQELIPYIDANFRTLNTREFRAIGGLSRGASWALHFALENPELFSSVGGHSPPIFVEDAPFVRSWLEAMPAKLRPRIWLDIGEKDQQAIMNSVLWFEEMLTEMNIAHQWHLFPGNHDEAYWSSHLELYLRWYSENW